MQLLPSSPNTSQPVTMLAIIKQWEETNSLKIDNTEKYFFLLLLKLGMDTVYFYVCCQKKFTNFGSVCSLSIILADLLLTFLLATVWFLGAERPFVTNCFLLAHASATFGALPLPMMCLGLLDYCLEANSMCNHRERSKLLRNVVLTLLVWMQAVIFSMSSANTVPVELDFVTGMKVLACEVKESTLIPVLHFGLFMASLLTVLPYWSEIPRWLKEADRIYEAREQKENPMSDLFFTSAHSSDISEKTFLENNWSRPPLWLSLTLGFLVFWMPYLAVTVACMIGGISVPAYISVNLLWLDCTNSFLTGVVFLVKSKTQGPQSNLPENMCSWQIYWHLSKGTQQFILPKAVFNPSKEKINHLLLV
ncbi:putative G-protein coupled receptor 160 isoform 1-T2 [Odontesthes bonariensis]|uniref:putative G-protein coupled receptor 160 n=1 Tax=Odontesthes bonariensis TaxID=219752 RepID=UPI003F58D75C